MSTVVIEVDGVDITDVVHIGDATFNSQVNGVAGECSFRVKDTPKTASFTVGKIIRLIIDGENAWQGYVAKISRVYSFPYQDASNLSRITRHFLIQGFDINVLFTKRIVFNKGDPPKIEGPTYRISSGPTNDSTVISDLVNDWLDLSGDGLDTTSLVETVDTVNIDQDALPFGPAQTWAQAMASITELPAGIFYIDPDRRFVYTDVDTPNAAYSLSDQPTGGTSVGYRKMEILFDGTRLANDVLAWGRSQAASGPVFARVEDATSIADHGRWQMGVIRNAVYKQLTIDKVADTTVYGSPLNKRGHKDDGVSVGVTVRQPGFRVAQKVDFTSNAYGFNDVIPIRRMTIRFLNAKTPLYDLTLSHDIDIPWFGWDLLLFDFDMPRIHIPVVDGVIPPAPETGCLCGSEVIPYTDTFTRTLTNDLGASDHGIDWNLIITGSSPSWTTAGVNGSEAIFVRGAAGGNDGFIQANLDTFGTSASSIDWTIILKIKFTGSAADAIQILNGDNPDFVNSIYIEKGGYAFIDHQDGFNYSFEDGTITVPTNFYLKWEHQAGVEQRFKIWDVSDPEPNSWALTHDVSAEGPVSIATFEFDIYQIGSSTGVDIRLDDLLITSYPAPAGLYSCPCPDNLIGACSTTGIGQIWADTFERSVSSGTGAVLCGYYYANGNEGTLSVNGEALVVSDFTHRVTGLPNNPTGTYPFCLVASIDWTGAPWNSEIWLGTSSTFEANVDIDWVRVRKGDISHTGFLEVFRQGGSGPDWDFNLPDQFYLRVLIDETSTRARYWAWGDPEPASWPYIDDAGSSAVLHPVSTWGILADPGAPATVPIYIHELSAGASSNTVPLRQLVDSVSVMEFYDDGSITPSTQWSLTDTYIVSWLSGTPTRGTSTWGSGSPAWQIGLQWEQVTDPASSGEANEYRQRFESFNISNEFDPARRARWLNATSFRWHGTFKIEQDGPPEDFLIGDWIVAFEQIASPTPGSSYPWRSMSNTNTNHSPDGATTIGTAPYSSDGYTDLEFPFDVSGTVFGDYLTVGVRLQHSLDEIVTATGPYGSIIVPGLNRTLRFKFINNIIDLNVDNGLLCGQSTTSRPMRGAFWCETFPATGDDTFTVPQYQSRTTEVYLNGLRQRIDIDYEETSPDDGTVTFSSTPVLGQDSVRICFIAF